MKRKWARRLGSLALVVAFLASYDGGFALAAEEVEQEQVLFTSTQRVQGADIYIKESSLKRAVVVRDRNANIMDVSVVYLDAPETVYQFRLSASTFEDFSFIEVVSYAEDNLSKSQLVRVADVTYDEPIEVSNMRSSASADLQSAMANDLGSGPYSHVERVTRYRGGQTIKFYETMEFLIEHAGYKAWTDALTVASLIATFIGIANPSASLISAICNIFSVTVSASALLPAHSAINRYTCTAKQYRYASINGSQYMYNITYKFVRYSGYENASLNSTERAQIDLSSKTTEFPDGAAYYVDYNAQADDAYAMFQLVGQKP